MASNLSRRLIDIGANLTDPMFRGIYHSSQRHQDDYVHMLKRARDHGVEKLVITGGSLSESREALKLADGDENLFSTVGCHPTRCNEFNDYHEGPSSYYGKLRELAESNKHKVVAIGETGLDYDRLHFCPKEVQQEYFIQQLSLAEETKLPLFLHNRNSIEDFIHIMKKNRDKFQARGGVVHSFDGSPEDIEKILELDLYIGVNGCSLKSEQNLEAARLIPANRLMIETDCPWCEIKQTHASFKYVKTIFQKSKNASDPSLPVKNRNEPMNLIQVIEVMAAIRDESIEFLMEQIYTNTSKLFFNLIH